MDLQRVTTSLGPAPASLFAGGQPGDLIALDDLKLELDLTATSEDAYLRKLVTRASAAAAKFCNRVFTPALWRDDVWPAAGPNAWQLPPTLSRLQLAQWPPTATPSPSGTAPPLAPVLSSVVSMGAAAATYYVRLTYLTPAGETAASLESALTCAAGATLQVAAPGPDALNLATGYRVYVATASFAETLQSAAVAIGSSWTLATLTAGASPPNYVTVVEDSPLFSRPLAEGVDFLVDPRLGQIERFEAGRRPRVWTRPTTIVYNSGFPVMPDDIQEAVILLAKTRWFARSRDPMVRSQTIVGDYEASYWLGTGLGGQGDLPIDVAEKLERYRVKVVA